MITVFIIGTGNLGAQLCFAMESAGDSRVKLVGYSNKSGKKLPQIKAPLYSENLPQCDVYLLAVPDDAIENMSTIIPKSQAVAHMSGSVPLDVLSAHDHFGVLYIPQTFNKHRKADLEAVTICLESSSKAIDDVLSVVAGSLSRKRTHINSTQRQQLHLAAVYMNNFVNHCYYKSAEILKAADLDPKLLESLQTETLASAQQANPYKATHSCAPRLPVPMTKTVIIL